MYVMYILMCKCEMVSLALITNGFSGFPLKAFIIVSNHGSAHLVIYGVIVIGVTSRCKIESIGKSAMLMLTMNYQYSTYSSVNL